MLFSASVFAVPDHVLNTNNATACSCYHSHEVLLSPIQLYMYKRHLYPAYIH